ncbi:MAG: hypothetical protein KDA22_04370 [Phycisphaerales bacterium]|nr:hypothetical protein [Phycisphaerales bacterium]
MKRLRVMLAVLALVIGSPTARSTLQAGCSPSGDDTAASSDRSSAETTATLGDDQDAAARQVAEQEELQTLLDKLGKGFPLTVAEQARFDAILEAARIPPWTLASRPVIALDAARHPTPEAVEAEVHQLIAALAEIDTYDFGFSPTMSGTAFAPVEGTGQMTSGILMIDHRLHTTPAVRRLVEIGPAAIPALLAALGDATPTKLVLSHEGGFGAMWHAAEFPFNRAIARESAAVSEVEGLDRSGDGSGGMDAWIKRHEVTVGDVCFVVLGQIVNRPYAAIRYQPTACQVVNSPTTAPALAEAARRVWTAPEPTARLLESLLDDYSTRGTGTDDLQVGAALRLGYYFPTETNNLLAQRLAGLDLSDPTAGDPEHWRVVFDRNGVEPSMLLEAMARLEDPTVEAAVADAALRTDVPTQLLACLSPSLLESHSAAVFGRVAGFLESDAPRTYADSNLVAALIRNWPEPAQAEVERYLGAHDGGNGGVDRCRVAVSAAYAVPTRPAWFDAILADCLDDRRETGNPSYPRFCDEAASTLARVLDMPFDWQATARRRDASIDAMQVVLRGGKRPAPPSRPDVIRVAPVLSTTVDAAVSQVWPASTRAIVYGGTGYRGTDGWAYDTLTIDPATGAIVKRVKLDEWNGGVSIVRPVTGEHVLCYHGETIVDRDLATGAVLRSVATPFHDRFNEARERWVRNLLDLAAIDVADAVVATTPDGAVHLFELGSGAHEVLRMMPRRQGLPADFPMHVTVIPVEGTAQVLVSGGLGMDDPPLRWDAFERQFEALDGLPAGGWNGAWGRVAWNHTNGWLRLWDLDARELIELDPAPDDVLDVTSDGGQTIFLLRASGTIDVWRIGEPSTLVAELQPPPATGRPGLRLVEGGRTLAWWSVAPRPDPEPGAPEVAPCDEPPAVGPTAIALFDVSAWTAKEQ